MKHARSAVWILEDQLSPAISSLAENPDARVLMIESRRNFSDFWFHKKRIAFLIAAMRHFAGELRDAGRTVAYFSLSRRPYLDTIPALRQFVKSEKIERIIVAEPSEHHTKVWIESLEDELRIKFEFLPNNLFLIDRDEFANWARKLKSPVMESFYRRMRKQHGVLMNGDEPVGGKWNLDKQNRKPASRTLHIPRPVSFSPDNITAEAIDDVNRVFRDHPGTTDGFNFAVTRTQAAKAFDDFIENRLPLFGDYEDAMLAGEPIMYHSHLSMLLNVGLLEPMKLIRAAEREFAAGRAPLNSVEGFIRQILGWREYVYGIYWTFMPEYRTRNARGETRPLPDFFWTGETDMNCLRHCIGNVVENAYAHHIQRLMVICNFATLAGLSPQAVNDWFYSMFVDSHDWVVTPNVIGMGMNADGGTMATKPYVSSAAYIHRMSDYCSHCRFDHKKRTGDEACPFNSLYWAFLDRHRETLAKNPRMTMILKNLDRMDSAELRQLRSQADRFVNVTVKVKK